MSSSWLTLSFMAVVVTVASAVGPVMNQQPTLFDLIQNEPELSEVSARIRNAQGPFLSFIPLRP